MTEAASSGVPVVGIPVFGDQPRNMAAVEANGAGIKIDLHDLTYENIFNAVHTAVSYTHLDVYKRQHLLREEVCHVIN